MNTSKFIVTLLIFSSVTIGLTGCQDDSTSTSVSKPIIENTDKPSNNRNKTGSGNSDIHHDNASGSSDMSSNKGSRKSTPIKIGTVMPDALHSETWNVYIIPDSVNITNTNPYEFTCKGRVRKIEDEASGEVELNPKLTTYDFYEDDGVIYCYSVNHLKWENTIQVKKDRIASMIYKYVSKNM